MGRKVKAIKNDLRRTPASLNYIRQIYVFTEGSVTEAEYLGIAKKLINEQHDCHYKFALHINTNKGKSSSKNLLDRIRRKSQEFINKDLHEIWILFDQDRWPASQIESLRAGVGIKNKPRTYQALISIPKFEVWLILHFENAKGISTASEVDSRLKKYIPDYKKHLPENIFNLAKINNAISNSKLLIRNNSAAQTQVYKLIEHLIDLSQKQ